MGLGKALGFRRGLGLDLRKDGGVGYGWDCREVDRDFFPVCWGIDEILWR